MASLPAVFTDWPTIPMCIAGMVEDYGCDRDRAALVLSAYAADRAGPVGMRDRPDDPVRQVELTAQQIEQIDWLTGSAAGLGWRIQIMDMVLEAPAPVIFINAPAFRAYAERHLGKPRQGAKGGRPPKYDWTAGAVEVGRWVFHRGIPDPVAPLVVHLQVIMAGSDGAGPDERDVRRWLAGALKKIRAPFEGEK